jgi:hypothetical protein
MADLSGLEASSPSQIVGGDELYAADVDSQNSVKTLAHGQFEGANLPLLTDSDGALVVSAQVTISSLPSFREFIRFVLAAGAVRTSTYLLSEQTAIKEFHVGGTVACQGTIALANPADVELLNGFNSAPQVASWTNTSAGDSAAVAWVYSTAQFTEGTGSASHTFTRSDGNHYPEISFTFPSPRNLSSWRYILGSARTTVAGGGGQSRSVQIRLRSGTAIRIWQVTGQTDAAPFSTEQWHSIVGDLESPHALDGTGSFDINSVNSISLRLQDGGNKTGTVWWDNIRLSESFIIRDRIYSSNGTTNQVSFDPVLVFEPGEYILMRMKNNASISGEVQIVASGVEV